MASTGFFFRSSLGSPRARRLRVRVAALAWFAAWLWVFHPLSHSLAHLWQSHKGHSPAAPAFPDPHSGGGEKCPLCHFAPHGAAQAPAPGISRAPLRETREALAPREEFLPSPRARLTRPPRAPPSRESA